MTKVTAKILGAQALREVRDFKRGEVKVTVKGGISAYSYEGNDIAVNGPGGLKFSMAGWPSCTTAAHLRTIGAGIHTVKGVACCSNHPINTDVGVWYRLVEGKPVRTDPIPTAHKLGD